MYTASTRKEIGQQALAADAFPWAFFVLAFGFTWLVCLPGVLAARGLLTLAVPNMALVAIAQFGPSLAAFLLVFRTEGKAGALRLAKRALNVRIPIRWLAPTLFLPPILAGIAYYLNVATGGQPATPQLLFQPVPAAVLPTFIFIFLLQGPVPEEFGWRGYALDRLQTKWSALASSLMLGAIWAVWHLPTFFMEGIYQSFLPFWAFVIAVTAEAVLITWLYNNTGRNLLVALLFHTMINLSNAIFPTFDPSSGGDFRAFVYLMVLDVIAAALVVAIWGPKKLRRQANS